MAEVHIVGFRNYQIVSVLSTQEAADRLAAALLMDNDWEGLEVLTIEIEDEVDPRTLDGWS